MVLTIYRCRSCGTMAGTERDVKFSFLPEGSTCYLRGGHDEQFSDDPEPYETLRVFREEDVRPLWDLARQLRAALA